MDSISVTKCRQAPSALEGGMAAASVREENEG